MYIVAIFHFHGTIFHVDDCDFLFNIYPGFEKRQGKPSPPPPSSIPAPVSLVGAVCICFGALCVCVGYHAALRLTATLCEFDTGGGGSCMCVPMSQKTRV